MTTPPVLLWFRRDLRLDDNEAVAAACASGRPVVPVFVFDETTGGAWAPGGASRWWMHHSLAALDAQLQARGSRLVLRRGALATEIPRLMAETGAVEIHTGEAVEPWARRALDALSANLPIRPHRTALLFHPEEVRTGSGTPFGVYSPFARACRRLFADHAPIPAPQRLPPCPDTASDSLADWGIEPPKPDWAAQMRALHRPGTAGARARLQAFLPHLQAYDANRNRPDLPGTSMLSSHLAWGEISPREIWRTASESGGGKGLETFQNELLWREFSAHLLWHFPALPDAPMKPAFADFPWREDRPALRAWQRGETGIPIVDAGMRQLWTTGWMHNRVRMIVASFLVKHLLLPWQEGEAWFWDTLVDADLASNAASWQWVAGSGADAAPYFRVFNPVLQGHKFDPSGAYVRRHVPELRTVPDADIHTPWLASAPSRGYPAPIVDLALGRARALDALKTLTKTAA